mgnify:CR=1 FL=1|jgi:hercynine metabolism small protein|tara:strand:+ start:829 stop:1083 length:255 start_codon:yes stop_codon:yes gene_type:complete
MNRADQLRIVREQREMLICELNATYAKAFNRLADLKVADRTLAKLAQLVINSRDSAMKIMNEKIEAPLITSAPIPLSKVEDESK